ncbi:MAG TPA: nucleotidyltransferase domain-containing protein [Longimicrobium sp.]|nr:nucleotidyltransferase domain-containing protein [Longimicrobium sp.]
MPPESLKPHTRAEREAAATALIPLWQRKFGHGLLAVAATGSFARGDDRAYSDLELLVFLRDMPGPGEDPYLQRVVDGMLVEAE